MFFKRKFLFVPILILLLPFVNYYMISLFSEKFIFSNIAALPAYRNLLVFGAGRNYPSDRPNMAFTGRMDAAERIARVLPIEKIIVSGSANLQENEALEMKRLLVSRGVDPSIILIDSAAVNTSASINNYRKRFGSVPAIMISSESHLQRALYYSHLTGSADCGYATKADTNSYVRELFSRLYTSWLVIKKRMLN